LNFFPLNTQEDNLAQQTRRTLGECFDQIRLARATELAQSRRFLEAESLLSPNGRLPESARELDLLARIAAQQKRFREARRLWETALQKTPGDNGYQDAIKQIERAERANELCRKVLLACVAVLFIATLVFLTFKFWPWHSRGTAKQQIPHVQQALPSQPQQKPKPAPAQTPTQPARQAPPPSATPQKQ
jgi:tetratricopeptide (TPR) repeat protein